MEKIENSQESDSLSQLIEAVPTDLNENNVQEQPSDSFKAKEIVNKVVIEKNESTNMYSFNTISQILEQSLELAEGDFIEATAQNRQERRELMESDVEGYLNHILKENDFSEKILEKAQKTILDILEIPNKDFEESFNFLNSNGYSQKIYELLSENEQNLKKKVVSTQDVSFEKTKEILRFQIEILKNPPELLKKLIEKLSASQETAYLIPTLITRLLNDYIYKEFKVEDEDQKKVLQNPDIFKEQDILGLFQEVGEVMFNVISPSKEEENIDEAAQE